jgi:general secretion pathway protein N
MRRTLLVSVVLALLAAALAVFAPAALVGAPLEEFSRGRLALAEPEGTVWRGRGVLAAGPDSRLALAWSIDAWPLLRGELRMHLRPFDNGGRLPRGEISVSRGKLAVRELDVEIPADMLRVAAGTNAIRVSGDVRVASRSLDWSPPVSGGKAELVWRDASIAGPIGAPIALGSVTTVVSSTDGGFSGSVANQGGDLGVLGTVAWRSEAGREVSLHLAPRSADKSQLADLLAAIGTPEGAGWRVRWRTGPR